MKTKLGDICIIDWGNTSLTKKSYKKNGKFLAVSAKGCDGRINHYEHEEDTCVLSAIGAQCGKMFLPKEKFTAIKNTITLKPRKQIVGSKFLFYLFTYIELPKRGAAQPFISKTDIEKFEIDYLPNLKEQSLIVDKLDIAFSEINSIITNNNKNLKDIKKLKDKVFDEIINKVKYENFFLNDVCKVERGSSPRPIKSFLTESEDGVNWIMINDTKLDGKYIDSTKLKITKDGAKKSRSVKKGDLVLTNSMSYGRPYIMSIDGYIHDGWFVLRLNDNIDNEYLYFLLSSSNIQKQFKSLAAGAVVKNISGDLVKKTILSIPTKKVQIEVRKKLSIINEYIQKIENITLLKISNYEKLKKSLFRNLMNFNIKQI